MKRLLFLAHRIPYPPNKGDKIRSFHVLAHVCRRYRVHLGAFVDSADDWKYATLLKSMCAATCFRPLPRMTAYLRSARGFVRNESLTASCYRDAVMAAWVQRQVRDYGIDRFYVFSSCMGQYVLPLLSKERQAVIDFVDVDSDKWRQYSNAKSGALRWLYAREHRRLLAYERALAQRCNAAVFVTPREAQLFRALAPEAAHKVAHSGNGVDTQYFSPERSYPSPYARAERVLVFVGAMDYWANVQAVRWFAREVFPAVLATCPHARFYIVGTRPARQVLALAAGAGVHVTGAVADVRPYLAHAAAAVVPLLIARGVQNKLLEAMAMGRCIIATPEAVAALEPRAQAACRVAGTAADFIAMSRAVLADDATAADRTGRDSVLAEYRWERQLSRLDQLLAGAPAATAAADVGASLEAG